jgi:Tfp pilus assembly protein PilN
VIYPRWAQNLLRADFLKSVGLYLTPSRLYLVRLRKELWRVSVTARETRELPAAETVSQRRQALSEAMQSLLPHFDPSRDPFYLCLSPHLAVSVELLLPKVAAENLSQVVAYEIERHIPYRKEEVYYGLLPAQIKGEKLSVFLFAVPRPRLDEILDILAALGIAPRGAETTATAVPNYLLFAAGGIKEPAVVLGGQEGVWEILGLEVNGAGRGKKPRIFFSQWLPQADWVTGLGKELLRASLKPSGRVFTWGYVADLLLPTEEGSLQEEDLLSLGTARLGIHADLDRPGFIPAVCAALQGVREASFASSVLPGLDQSDAGRAVSALNALLVAALMFGLIGWAGSFLLKAELRVRQLQKQNQEIAPAVEALRGEEDELHRVRSERLSLNELSGNRGEVLKILAELSRAVPTSAYFSSLRYRGDVVDLQGSAESASGLIPLLERSSEFENVKFTAPSNRGRDNRETFSLRADLERPKSRAGK